MSKKRKMAHPKIFIGTIPHPDNGPKKQNRKFCRQYETVNNGTLG